MKEDLDDTFAKLFVGQLKLIPECDLKDDLKISLQQMRISFLANDNSLLAEALIKTIQKEVNRDTN